MISLFGSSLNTDEIKAVGDCVDRQWIGVGPLTKEFESKMASFLNAQDFIFVNSGSNALQLALKLLDLPEGSEVVLPSFTWIACANAVQLNRLKPIFCDVDYNSCNVRPQDMAPFINKKTSALMVVHYAGKPVHVDEFKMFNLPIVEDAAHATNSKWNNDHCGTMGDIGIFSFDPVKNLTTGEGGGLVANEPAFMETARKLRYCGIGKSGFEASGTHHRWWEYNITHSFPKLLNTDIAAGIGLAQLNKFEQLQKRRQEIWDKMTSVLTKEKWASEWLDCPPGPEKGEHHSYFTYLIKLKFGDRDKLAHFLLEKKIYTSLRFHPLHLNRIYQSNTSLPHCEKLNETALNLPLHPRLTDNEVDHILLSLKSFREAL